MPSNRLAGPVAGAATLALVAACCAASWPDSSPLVPRRGGHPGGDPVWAWIYLGCVLAAFATFVAGLAAVRRGGVRLRTVAVLAALIQLAPLGAPLLLSTDAWTYWGYGRIAAVHGGNPYADPPSRFPGDAAFPHLGEDWRDSTSVYGPAFTLASEPLALAAGRSADAAAWIYKGLAAAAMLGVVALVTLLASRRAFAAAFVGWNPLLALHFAGGGHNDVWMALLVAAALGLAATGRRRLAGAAWAASILVKWVPLLLLPLRALEARATGRRVDHIGFALAAATLGVAATVRYGWDWVTVFGPLARNATEQTAYALPQRLDSIGLPDHTGVAVLAAGFGVAYGWLLREAARGRARLGLATGLLLLATPWLVPWYVVWSAPLAAIEDDPAALAVTLAVSAYLLPQALPL
ncbi:MAG: glycosyltransferase 87 family protein [Gaiellaceae bacterium]